MKFLEAKKILRNNPAGTDLEVLVAASGQTENLSPYLEAHFALVGYSLSVNRLPFNTLQQALLSEREPPLPTLYLLFPWDFCGWFDWRSYRVNESKNVEEYYDEIKQVAARLSVGSNIILYVPAACPPITEAAHHQESLQNTITSTVLKLNGLVLEADVFDLLGYIENGLAIKNAQAAKVSRNMCETYLNHQKKFSSPKKIIITDLDNTLWGGVIGEDGVTGLNVDRQGAGARHYLYQTFLKRLSKNGVLLAVVSKNDEDLARQPFQVLSMPLAHEDFVIFKTGYGKKSALLKALLQELNLGEDAAIFVDDNPVEIDEVSQRCPSLVCLEFPAELDQLPTFFTELSARLRREVLTDDDKRRSGYYALKARVESAQVAARSPEEFLLSLDMKLMVNQRDGDNFARALQLINKTNQFNLNGQRITEDELKNALSNGARLYTAGLSDKFGDHGEVIACLVDAENVIRYFVMSCRVLQRKVENRFLLWLLEELNLNSIKMAFLITERNSPFVLFLKDELGVPDSELSVKHQAKEIITAHKESLSTSKEWLTVAEGEK